MRKLNLWKLSDFLKVIQIMDHKTVINSLPLPTAFLAGRYSSTSNKIARVRRGHAWYRTDSKSIGIWWHHRIKTDLNLFRALMRFVIKLCSVWYKKIGKHVDHFKLTYLVCLKNKLKTSKMRLHFKRIISKKIPLLNKHS